MSADFAVHVANVFELTASKETFISYFADANRKPHRLNYKTQSVELNFNSSEIQKFETNFGTILTVIIEKTDSVVGGNEVLLTLLLPTVTLLIGDKGEKPVKTEALLTTQKIGKPGIPTAIGQQEKYEVLSLKGTAKYVDS
ncbi:hypothetical protein HW132_31890 [Brasilonema sp. CT11]|nr:hypothetical protein [Brasilonema sp. CT11]